MRLRPMPIVDIRESIGIGFIVGNCLLDIATVFQLLVVSFPRPRQSPRDPEVVL